MFDKYPTYFRYRSLRVATPMMVGEDVYALQTALNCMGLNSGAEDGILGKQTGKAILLAQAALGLVQDGLAGGVTQREIAFSIVNKVKPIYGLPNHLLDGQVELESGPRLGNYSPQRADGTYDAGVVQMNTKFTDPEDGFHTLFAIDSLGKKVRKHYDLFEGVKEDRRRWGLAQGSWNAPAFACYLAKQEGALRVPTNMTLKPSASALATFEAYIEHCLIYYKG